MMGTMGNWCGNRQRPARCHRRHLLSVWYLIGQNGYTSSTGRGRTGETVD
jgi:hypothetical protein